MKNLLNYKSLIKVAIMIVVIALIGSQMMDTDAGRGKKKKNRDYNNTSGGGQNSGSVNGDGGVGAVQAEDDPDFSTVDDPLDGDYQLFSVDDLVVRRPVHVTNGDGTTSTNYGYDVFLTEDEQIQSEDYTLLRTVDCELDYSSQATAVGRFFALPNDTIITIVPYDCSGNGDIRFIVEDPVTGQEYVSDVFSGAGTEFVVTADDFDGDGFDDLFVLSESTASWLRVRDVNDITAGLERYYSTPIDSDLAPISDLTTGDFNGDGYIDVAWIVHNRDVHFATVCGRPNRESGNTVCFNQSNKVLINPLESGANLIKAHSHNAEKPQVVAGKFSSAGTVGLALITRSPDNTNLYAEWYEFDSNFNTLGGSYFHRLQLTSSLYPGAWEIFHAILATSAKLDWFGSTDQIVIGVTREYPGYDLFMSHVRHDVIVVSFDEDQMQKDSWDEDKGGYYQFVNVWPIITGIAAGHFSTIDDASSEGDFNLQIAVERSGSSII